MNTRILTTATLMLAFSIGAGAQVQLKDTASKSKEESLLLRKKKAMDESILIRKKKEQDEKMTIQIDGDKITINGKPLDQLKGEDIEVIRNSTARAIRPMMPQIRAMVKPQAGMKIMSDVNYTPRAFLGVVTEKTDKGAKINSVEKESAAEKAGLKKDDIITKIGDTKIESSEGLYDAVGKFKPEEKISISYLRDGKEASTTAVLGKSSNTNVKVFNFNNQDFKMMPDDYLTELDGRNFNFNYSPKPRLGMEIQDVEEGKGVKVLNVDSNSPSAKAGLQKDDVITEADGKTIESVDDLRNKTRELKEGSSIKLTFRRNGKTQSTDIKFPKKIKTADL